jgi:glucose-1-phosphate thymidylyltransferase
MNLIIPMAGRGSRLRPHTLTVPKPLLPIAGKPMVQRLVEDIAHSLPEKIEEIAFVIGDFGKEVEKQLCEVAAALGARCKIYLQDEPLGVGHAIYCAHESMNGHCLIAFSDTLFNATFAFDLAEDGIIWVKQVPDPVSFGVVKVDAQSVITDFVEKSPVFVSDLAIVGIYYFRDGEKLREELGEMIRQGIKDKGEFQLTTALELLKNKGLRFRPAYIEEWLDCGNKDNVIATNSRMLEIKNESEVLLAPDAEIIQSVIIPPCSIGAGAVIRNSVVGPYVSVGNNSELHRSVISSSIVQRETIIHNANLVNSLIGNNVDYSGEASEISLGDYSKM